MRVHIGGGAGSGKTTLATRLSVLLNAPAYDLDAAGYSPDWSMVEIATRRQELIAELTDQKRWITAGTFVGWPRPIFEMADVIVFLDIRFSTAARRIVLRHVNASLAGTNQHKGVVKLWRFLRRTRAWYASSGTHDEAHRVPAGTTGITHLTDTQAFFARYSHKLTVCRSDENVQELLSTLTQKSV